MKKGDLVSRVSGFVLGVGIGIGASLSSADENPYEAGYHFLGMVAAGVSGVIAPSLMKIPHPEKLIGSFCSVLGYTMGYGFITPFL